MARFRGLAPVEENEGLLPPEPARPDAEFDTDPEMRAQLLGALGDKVWSGAVAGVDRPARTPADKLGLFAQTAALACDMESHAVAEAAREAAIPFLVLRVVSDPSNRFVPEAALSGLTAAGSVSLGRVLRGVSLRPWELFEFLPLALDARIAFAALRRVALLGAPLFGAVG